MEAFESGILGLKGFYFPGDSYHYRLEANAKRRFLSLLKDRFNSGVHYRGCTFKWDITILRKPQELARYLTGKTGELDFTEPSPYLKRNESQKNT